MGLDAIMKTVGDEIGDERKAGQNKWSDRRGSPRQKQGKQRIDQQNLSKEEFHK